jgi:hypothetical protein
MWGWDWCRPILTQGVWKKIEVIGYEQRIVDAGIFQNHQADGTVQLEIQVTVGGHTSGNYVEATVVLSAEGGLNRAE